MRRRVLAGVILSAVVSALPLWGQDATAVKTQVPVPAVAALLEKIYAYAARYRATLPSLECDEAIVSQRAMG